MSDEYRKDFSTRAQEKITPDSSKSTTDKASEGITNTADKAAGSLQSDSSKSGTQEAFDKTRGEKDEQTGSGGLMDKAKDTLGLNK